MVLIAKGPWLPWHEHPSRASILVHPCAHGLIQTTHPTWCKLLYHVFVPGLQRIPHLPKAIPEDWWVTCCNGKCLKYHFTSNGLCDMNTPNLIGALMKESTSPRDQNSECSGPLMVPSSQLFLHFQKGNVDHMLHRTQGDRK